MEFLTLPVLALVAGFVSFSSPCCLPLVPGYLSYMSALPVSELDDREARRVTVRASFLFVAGFTVVFTALGVGVTLVGSLFLRNQDTLVRVFGVVIIVMGLVTMGAVRIPSLMREKRVDLGRLPRGPAFAFPMGMAFAAGWAPCIGPVWRPSSPRRQQRAPSPGAPSSSPCTPSVSASRSWSWPSVSLGRNDPWRGSAATGGASRSPGGSSSSPSASCSSPAGGARCSGRFSARSPTSDGRRYDGSHR